MKKTFLEFRQSKGITDEQFAEMSAEKKAELYNEYNTELKAYIDGLESNIEGKATKADLDKAISDLNASKAEEMKLLNDNMREINARFKAMNENGGKPDAAKGLRQYIEENSEVLRAMKAAGKANQSHKGISFEVDKATQGASDIDGRDYLGTIEAGIEKKPVRQTSILNLFGRQSVTTEYLHYWEENVVTRDAKFVIACATSTHTTKKTWAKRTVELAKIRDIVDICLDMLDDYAFVEGEIRALVDESIQLKAEYELLLGASAAATDMLSIDHIASEFNHANPLAVYTAKFQAPTLGDLTAAMKAQIYTFGQNNKWTADTVIMNYNDMITYLHAKDANNNYLFPTFVYGATDMVNGMRIVTSPIVAPNTLYVIDSTKGKILDRKRLAVTASFENKDNIEHELVTFVASERLQFHVRLINRDAFMKCSDVAQALIDIAVVPAP
jgi:HK97 family phage major capsid protein